MTTTLPPIGPLLPLAILPNGEAGRPDEVSRVLIEVVPSLVEEAGERFAVAVHLTDGSRRIVASGVTRQDAADLGRRCARAINDAGRQGA